MKDANRTQQLKKEGSPSSATLNRERERSNSWNATEVRKRLQANDILKLACSMNTQGRVATLIGNRATQPIISNWLRGRTSIPPWARRRLRDLLPQFLMQRLWRSKQNDCSNFLLDTLDEIIAQLACLRKKSTRLSNELADYRKQVKSAARTFEDAL